MKLIAQSLAGDEERLESYENLFSEGDSGEIRLYLERNASEEELTNLQDTIISAGVRLREPVTQFARIVSVKFEKRIWPLAIIALVVLGVGVVLLGWQLFKAVAGIPWWVWLAGGGILTYYLLRRR